MRPMRIAVIAPLRESIPSRLYGGSERVVSFLTEELVAQGHEVTLFGSGQSIAAARLYRGFPDMPLVSISNAQRAPIPRAACE